MSQNFVIVSETCYYLFFENYGVPTEITAKILNYVRLDLIAKRSQEIEREKLICWKAWYPDGTLEWEHNYKDGKQHGVQKRWYQNGVREYEDNYKDGLERGVCKGWYDDGTLWYEYNYKDGKHCGVQREWNQDGTLKCECDFKNGILYGI